MKKYFILAVFMLFAVGLFADSPLDSVKAGVDFTSVPGENPELGVLVELSGRDSLVDFYAGVGITDAYGKAGLSIQLGKNSPVSIYGGGGVQIGKKYKVVSYSDDQVQSITFVDTNLWWSNYQSQNVLFTDTDTDTFFVGYSFDPIGEFGLSFETNTSGAPVNMLWRLGYIYYAGDHAFNTAIAFGY